MTWIDWAVVAVLLFSLLQGLWRGMLTGLVSILGLIVGFIAAAVWYPSFAEILVLALRVDRAWAGTAAFLALLAAIYVVVGVLATILLWTRRMSGPARLVGGLVGVTKGGVLVAVLLAVAIASPLGDTVRRDVDRSLLVPYIVRGHKVVVKSIASALPSTVHLPDADKVRF